MAFIFFPRGYSEEVLEVLSEKFTDESKSLSAVNGSILKEPKSSTTGKPLPLPNQNRIR
jgi:hypothetical protein